jgi:hypothetical protein
MTAGQLYLNPLWLRYPHQYAVPRAEGATALLRSRCPSLEDARPDAAFPWHPDETPLSVFPAPFPSRTRDSRRWAPRMEFHTGRNDMWAEGRAYTQPCIRTEYMRPCNNLRTDTHTHTHACTDTGTFWHTHTVKALQNEGDRCGEHLS